MKGCLDESFFVVQNMVAVGILDTASYTLEKTENVSPQMAAATLGLLRNLCANDEIKTSVCMKSLGAILHTMETNLANPTVQEHGCAILAAMALRQPQNASSILDAHGQGFIVRAMSTYPAKVSLQRQGCLDESFFVGFTCITAEAGILDKQCSEGL